MKIFIIVFFWQKFFFSQKYFREDFLTIFSQISFVFDIFEIMYFAKFFIRNFAYCQLFRFAIFFSAMNVNTKFEDVSFLKKSKIFSDRTFGFPSTLPSKKLEKGGIFHV